jgi:ABC-type transporter Mla maintaining outer membrane lipid asymmetry permease subunit MlaE
MGLRTRGGGAAVGQSATSAVVAAITLIVLVDSAASFAVLGLQGR